MPDYVEILRSAFVDLWATVVLFLPKLLLALVVFLLGLFVAGILRGAVVRIINVLKINELIEKLEIKAAFMRAGIKLDIAEFFGWLVRWFVIILVLIAAADVLEWTQVTEFLNEVIAYLPNVMIAVIILLVGFILGTFVYSVVQSAVEAAKMHNAQFLAGLSKWSIVVFSFMAALVQLGIAQSLIQVLFTGFVAMLALAGGLAFGLGGKEKASKVLDQLWKDISSRR